MKQLASVAPALLASVKEGRISRSERMPIPTASAVTSLPALPLYSQPELAHLTALQKLASMTPLCRPECRVPAQGLPSLLLDHHAHDI